MFVSLFFVRKHMNFFNFFNKWIFPFVILIVIFMLTNIWVVIFVILSFIAYKIFVNRDFFYSVKAKRCVGESDYLNAVRNYSLAINVNSNKPAYHLEKGYTLMMLGDFEEAKKVLTSINTSKFPLNIYQSAQSFLSIVEWKLGNLETAIKTTEQLHEQNYYTTTTYGNLTYFYILNGQYDKALALSKEAYDYNSSDAAIIENSARIHHLTGDTEQALKLYKQLEEKNPRYPEAWYNYALLLIDLEMYQDANIAINKCLAQEFTALTAITQDNAKQLNETIQIKLSNQ